jgi:hypothetical protein
MDVLHPISCRRWFGLKIGDFIVGQMQKVFTNSGSKNALRVDRFREGDLISWTWVILMGEKPFFESNGWMVVEGAGLPLE